MSTAASSGKVPIASRGSSENTLRERERSNNGHPSNSEDGQTGNEKGDVDGEEKAFIGPKKPVGFWDPSLKRTRKWVLIEWAKTSTFRSARLSFPADLES